MRSVTLMLARTGLGYGLRWRSSYGHAQWPHAALSSKFTYDEEILFCPRAERSGSRLPMRVASQEKT